MGGSAHVKITKICGYIVRLEIKNSCHLNYVRRMTSSIGGDHIRLLILSVIMLHLLLPICDLNYKPQ